MLHHYPPQAAGGRPAEAAALLPNIHPGDTQEPGRLTQGAGYTAP